MSESVSESGTVWSITINNPTDEDRKALGEFPAFVKEVVGQDEIGVEGTLHFQGLVKCKYTVKFTAIKKWLNRAHIEKAKNVKALMNYVKKSETAVEGTQIEMSESVSESKEYITPSKFPRLVARKFFELMDEMEWKVEEEYLVYDTFDVPKLRDIAIETTIRHLIRTGWHIELLAVNPACIKALKTYWVDLCTDVQKRYSSESFLELMRKKLKVENTQL